MLSLLHFLIDSKLRNRFSTYSVISFLLCQLNHQDTLVFLLHSSRSEQMATLQSWGLLEVPSQWGFFPSHCHVMLEGRFRDRLVFPLIGQSALRGLLM